MTSSKINPFIFKDPLTGVETIKPDYSTKPLPSKARTLPQSSQPCPFCFLASQLPASQLTDNHATRKLLYSTNSSFLIENLWSPLTTIGGKNFLAIPTSHYTSFEELPPSDLFNLLDAITYAERELIEQVNKLTFFNIGSAAGSSIAHLHAQIVSSPQPQTEILKAISTPSRVYDDYYLAFFQDLVINKISPKPLKQEEILHTPQAYIPANMSRGFEVRFIGGTPLDRAILIQKIITLLSTPTDFNYNITLSSTASFAQLLPTFDQGMIYPHYFNLIIQLSDSRALASKLRQDFNQSQIDPNQP